MSDNNVASPRNVKNPTTSVTVVRMIDEAVAGSRFSLTKTTGIVAPAAEAATIEKIITMNMTSARPAFRLQTYTPSEATTAIAMP